MADQVGKSSSHSGTKQFKRKGHTSGAFGNSPSVEAKGAAKQNNSELKP